MAAPKTRKKKVVKRGARAKAGAQSRAAKKRVLRRRVQKTIDAKLDEVVKLALDLSAKGHTPDEIGARVKAELSGAASADVVDDVLGLVGPESIVKVEA